MPPELKMKRKEKIHNKEKIYGKGKKPAKKTTEPGGETPGFYVTVMYGCADDTRKRSYDKFINPCATYAKPMMMVPPMQSLMLSLLPTSMTLDERFSSLLKGNKKGCDETKPLSELNSNPAKIHPTRPTT